MEIKNKQIKIQMQLAIHLEVKERIELRVLMIQITKEIMIRSMKKNKRGFGMINLQNQ